MSGRVIAVVGPSGAGKDTLMHMASVLRPELRLIQRVITRPADAGGEDFASVTGDEFERLRLQGKFALDWEAHGLRYGIRRNEDHAALSLVNLSRSVLLRAAEIYPSFGVIHVSASPDALQKRLTMRRRENSAQIARRIAHETPFDPGSLAITNVDNTGSLEQGLAAFLAAIDEMAS